MRYIIEIDNRHYLVHGKVSQLVELIGILEPCERNYVSGKGYEYIPSGDGIKTTITTIKESEIKFIDDSERIKIDLDDAKKDAEQKYKWYIDERETSKKLQSQVDQLMQCVSELKAQKGGDEFEATDKI